MTNHANPPDDYWVDIGQARKGALALSKIPFWRVDQRLRLFVTYPILALPELPQALVRYAASRHAGSNANAYKTAADRLRQLHQWREEWQIKHSLHDYCVTLRNCARVLGGDERGNRRWNLERALELNRRATAYSPPGTLSAGYGQENEALDRMELAELGVTPEAHVAEALQLFSRARAAFSDSPTDLARCMMHEAAAHITADELGLISPPDLHVVADLLTRTRRMLGAGSDTHADLLSTEGRYQLALSGTDVAESLERARDLFQSAEKQAQPGSRTQRTAVLNQGTVCQRLAESGHDSVANIQRAIDCYSRYRALAGAAADQDGQLAANEGHAYQTLAGLGVNARVNGGEAIRRYKLACNLFPLGSIDLGLTLLSESAAHMELSALDDDPVSRLELAAQLARRAFETLGARNPRAAAALVNEASARARLAERGIEFDDNLKQAAELYRQSRSLLAETSPMLSKLLMNEGNIALRRAQSSNGGVADALTALALYHEALDLPQTEGLVRARLLIGVGNARRMLAERGEDVGNHASGALRSFAEAVAALEEMKAWQDALVAATNWGNTAFALGDAEEAHIAYEQATRALEAIRDSGPLLRDRVGWIERNAAVFKGLAEALLRLSDAAYQRGDRVSGRETEVAALTAIERGRSRLLLDLLVIEDLLDARVPAPLLERYRTIRRRAEALDEAISMAVDVIATERSDLPGSVANGKVPMAELHETLGRMAELERQFRMLAPDVFELARPLDVSGMRTLAKDMDRTLVVLWSGPWQARAFFIPQDGAIGSLVLSGINDKVVVEWMFGPGSPPDLTGWLGTYARYLTPWTEELGRVWPQWRPAPWPEWERQIVATLQQVYDGMIAPVRAWLREHDQQRITFVTGGLLGLLPLHAAAWQDDTGNQAYFIDEIDTVYAPSLRLLDRCVRRPRPDITSVLAVSVPSPHELPGLPFADWEIERIGSVVLEGRGEQAFTALHDATRTTVSECIAAHAVVHFACHGDWNADRPLQSALALSDGPLRLGELVNEGALRDVRVVTLSACDSSIGYRFGSVAEEYLGMPAGFIVAGAGSVIGTLWHVSDLASAFLMGEFYRRLTGGADLASALRESQRWLRDLPRGEALAAVRDARAHGVAGITDKVLADAEGWLRRSPRPFSHPRHWAAFVVVGAPDVSCMAAHESRVVSP